MYDLLKYLRFRVQRYNKFLRLPNFRDKKLKILVESRKNASLKVEREKTKEIIYFFFLAVAKAARSWAFGPVNPLSVNPLRLA